MSPHLSRKSELIFTFAERYLARVGNLTICVSEFERKHAVEVLKLDPKKIVVIPNGIAGPVVADRDQLRSDLSLAPSDQVIGWVGRMGAQKNPVLMVEAFAVVRRENPKLRLVMVGDGELRSDTETRAKELGIFEDVRFPGPADGAVMMNAFDAFALSSDYEGFPYVALEANAAGLPIASTKMGAVDEVAVPGKSGFFSPVGDSKGLGQQLLLAVQTGKIHPSYPTLPTMVEAIETEYRALIRK
jgi:glycosyltransferase involved in cell wall biosynthesis